MLKLRDHSLVLTNKLKIHKQTHKTVSYKIDDLKDILATFNDEEKLIWNEYDFTMLQNQALKSNNIEVIDMKEMIIINNVDIKHPRKKI